MLKRKHLHKMIKDVERKCSRQKPQLYLAYFLNYFPLLNFLVRDITPEVLKGSYSNCIQK